MTHLSNTNLLDDNIGGNLKNTRLQKTSQIAENPNTEIRTQQPQQQQIQQEVNKMPQQEENIANKYDNEQVPNNLSAKDYGTKQTNTDADEKKILGMKPALFYTLAGIAVIAGGYLLYNKYMKKGKGGKSSDAGAGAGTKTTPTATAEVKITDVPITK